MSQVEEESLSKTRAIATRTLEDVEFEYVFKLCLPPAAKLKTTHLSCSAVRGQFKQNNGKGR